MENDFSDILSVREFHYHMTSLENFEKILKTGELLSYAQMEAKGMSIPEDSSSTDGLIYFSKERTDKNNNLVKEGNFSNEILPNNKRGDVILLFDSETISKSEGYEDWNINAVADRVSLEDCIAILGRDVEISSHIREMISQSELPDISVMDLDSFRKARYSNTLNNNVNEFQQESKMPVIPKITFGQKIENMFREIGTKIKNWNKKKTEGLNKTTSEDIQLKEDAGKKGLIDSLKELNSESYIETVDYKVEPDKRIQIEKNEVNDRI